MNRPAALGHGISVIPLPLPFKSPPSVNAYVLEHADGLLLIDCGVDWAPGLEALESGFETLGLELSAVHTLVVSHLHPDHVGMAPRLLDSLDCRLVMHKSARDRISRYNDTQGLIERTLDLTARHGVPGAMRRQIADLGARPDWMPLLRRPDHLVVEGDSIPVGHGRHLEVLHTPGHDASHICLRDSRTGILFSGDHVLPRITPVIMYDEEIPDSLGDYLASLSKLRRLEVGLTYPAHGSIVERGSQRIDQIVLHHERRLSGMEDVVHLGPVTAWQVLESVFRPNLTPLEQRLALRETVAHLEHLRLGDRLKTFVEDGTIWYRR